MRNTKKVDNSIHFSLGNARIGLFLKRKKFSLLPVFKRDDSAGENALFVYWLRNSYWVTWPNRSPKKNSSGSELIKVDLNG